MRLDSAVALAALITLLPSACDVQVDVDHDRSDRGSWAAIDPLPDAGPDTEVWFRDYQVVVVDEPLSIGLELWLRPDRTFQFAAEVEEADGGVERTVIEGRYRWDGDLLTLEDDAGDPRVLRRRGEELEIETEWPGDVVLAVTRLPRPALLRAR